MNRDDMPPEVRAQFDEMKRERQRRIEQLPAMRAKAIEALTTIVTAIRNNPTTGQVKKLCNFLAGVYNGPAFPFDLTDLRGLDTKLADACLAYLDYDRVGEREVHTLGVIDGEELRQHLEREGTYYDAQKRRIGRELYDSKHPDGHKDEGARA